MTPQEAQIEIVRRRAQQELLPFMHWVWWMPRPLRVGRHTRALCARLTRAVDDWLQGKSTYLIVNMPFRHGKSDIVSRGLPSFFLGRAAQQQPDVIMSGYGTELIKGFSKKVQNIIRSPAYQQLFPGVLPSQTYHAVNDWQIEGSAGAVTAVGIGGSITGKGGHLIILDDYCKNREEAESKTLRDKLWESFSDDLMTRVNSPAAIVIVCATRWHTDDIVGRIYEAMKNDPDYPRFESLIFPARKPGKDGWDILFPELYTKEWYDARRAQLGSYSAAALLDCNPVTDAMKTFKPEWLNYYDKPPARDRMNVYTFVDGANSKKEQADFTTMWTLGYAQDQNIYVLDLVHDRLSLTERTDELFRIQRDPKLHPSTTFFEQVGAMSDVAHIQDIQNRDGWHFPIIPLNHRAPKENRIRSLVPDFENGRIWFPRTLHKKHVDGTVHEEISEFVESEYDSFPACRHDDELDPLADINDPEVRRICHFPRPQTEDEYRGRAENSRANTDWDPFA